MQDNVQKKRGAGATILRGVSADMFSYLSLFLLNLAVAAQCIASFGANYGYWLAAYTLISILAFFEIGTGQFFVREYCIEHNAGNSPMKIGALISTMLSATCSIAIVIIITGMAAAPFVMETVANAADADNLVRALRLATLYLGIAVPLGLFKLLHLSLQNSGTYGLLGLIEGAVTGVLTLVLLPHNPHYTTLIGCQFAGLAAATTLAAILLPRSVYGTLTAPEKSVFRSMFQFCRGVFATKLCFIVRERTDTPVISHFVGPEAVIVYAVTQRLVRVPLTVLGSITSSAFAPLSKLSVSESNERFSEFFFRMISHVIAGAFACAIGCFFFNQLFVDLWVGDAFYGGAALSAIVALWLPAEAISRGFASVLWATNQLNFLVRANVAEALLNIVLTLLAAPYLGIAGVALGTLLATILTSFWMVPRAAFAIINSESAARMKGMHLKYFGGLAALALTCAVLSHRLSEMLRPYLK